MDLQYPKVDFFNLPSPLDTPTKPHFGPILWLRVHLLADLGWYIHPRTTHGYGPEDSTLCIFVYLRISYSSWNVILHPFQGIISCALHAGRLLTGHLTHLDRICSINNNTHIKVITITIPPLLHNGIAGLAVLYLASGLKVPGSIPGWATLC